MRRWNHCTLSLVLLSPDISFIFLSWTHTSALSWSARRPWSPALNFRSRQDHPFHQNPGILRPTAFFASNGDSIPNPDELSRQKAEVLESIADFHDGSWVCPDGAFSFSITSDVAAGITSKRVSAPYTTSSSLRMGPTLDTQPRHSSSIRMVETFSWEPRSTSNAPISSQTCCVFSRTIPWDQSVDVDSVDSSYSFDMKINAQRTTSTLPLEISGHDPTDCVFFIEKVLALSNDERIRVMMLYEHDEYVSESNYKLARVVLCREQRSEGMTPARSSTDPIHVMEPVTLLTLSMGPWLGDLIVRDRLSPQSGFAEWMLGVQKVAMRFEYDFESSVKLYWDYGRSLGVSVHSNMPLFSKGIIDENGMSRRIHARERILYIDYDSGVYAAFLVGSVYVKAPRFITLAKDSSLSDSGKQHKHSEFIVFHKERGLINTTDNQRPELYCSRMTRLYDSRGLFVQGSTSFLTLQPSLED